MKNSWIKKQCLNCNKNFLTRKSQCKERIKNGKKCSGGKYCSMVCFRQFFSKNFKPSLGKTWKHTLDYRKRLSDARKGKNNPMYIHGEYSGKKRRGLTKPQMDWRKKVFARDKYACQICKAKNGNGKSIHLQAHHIKPWAISRSNRFKVSNGITLCNYCHRKLHKLVIDIKNCIGNRPVINDYLIALKSIKINHEKFNK